MCVYMEQLVQLTLSYSELYKINHKVSLETEANAVMFLNQNRYSYAAIYY